MIIALKENGYVYFAITYGYYLVSGTDDQFFYEPDNINIWKVKGCKNTLMAGDNRVRDNDLLRYEKLFKGPLTIEKIDQEVIPKMTAIFKKYGRLDKNGQFLSTFYLAQKDQLYKINLDKSITYIEKVASETSYHLIYASIILSDEKTPEKKMIKALEKTMIFYANLHLPIAIMNTKTEKISYFKG